MHNPHAQSVPLDAGVQLHLATGTARSDDLGFCAGEIVHFARQHLKRRFVVGDELTASRTAAPIRFGQFDEFKPVDEIQNLAGLFPNLLRAAQMTWVVIGDPRFDASLRFFERDFGQVFADIPNLAAELFSPLRPFGIILEISAVFL